MAGTCLGGGFWLTFCKLRLRAECRLSGESCSSRWHISEVHFRHQQPCKGPKWSFFGAFLPYFHHNPTLLPIYSKSASRIGVEPDGSFCLGNLSC